MSGRKRARCDALSVRPTWHVNGRAPTDFPVRRQGIDANGTFAWGEGNIGGVDAGEVTLVYGQTFHIKGWTVLPAFDGTRFTNDASGHGMFVSIGRVSPS
jgi:hypothetical protein